MNISKAIRILAALPFDETIIKVSKDIMRNIDLKLRNKFCLNNKIKPELNKKILVCIESNNISVSFKNEKRDIVLEGSCPFDVLLLLRFLWQLQNLRIDRKAWDDNFDFRGIIRADQASLLKGVYLSMGPEADRYTEPNGRMFGPLKHNTSARKWKKLELELCYELPPKLNFEQLLFARLVVPSIYRDTGLTVYGLKGRKFKVLLETKEEIGRGVCDTSLNLKTGIREPLYWLMDAPYKDGMEADDPWIELDKDKLINHLTNVNNKQVLKLYILTDRGVMINAASFNLELFGKPKFRIG